MLPGTTNVSSLEASMLNVVSSASDLKVIRKGRVEAGKVDHKSNVQIDLNFIT